MGVPRTVVDWKLGRSRILEYNLINMTVHNDK